MKTGQIQLREIMAHGINIPINKEEVHCQCRHWKNKNKKLIPTVMPDEANPKNWECEFCDATFPIKPIPSAEAENAIASVLDLVNQVQFWSVKLNNETVDTETLSALRRLLPEFAKMQKEIYSIVAKQKDDETPDKE